MRKSVIGVTLLVLLCTLSGCQVFSTSEVGDYILQKEDDRILVAENISREDADQPFGDLREKKVTLIHYIVEDSELLEQLEVGDKVKITPKVNEEGFYHVRQSDPPQIIAGGIEIED